MTSKRQEDIRTLCDLHTPWTDEHKALVDKVYGVALPSEPIKRQPYDSLYLKQKHSQEL